MIVRKPKQEDYEDEVLLEVEYNFHGIGYGSTGPTPKKGIRRPIGFLADIDTPVEVWDLTKKKKEASE